MIHSVRDVTCNPIRGELWPINLRELESQLLELQPLDSENIGPIKTSAETCSCQILKTLSLLSQANQKDNCQNSKQLDPENIGLIKLGEFERQLLEIVTVGFCKHSAYEVKRI